MLKLELHALDEDDFRLDLTGFSGDELTKVMFGELIEPDEFTADAANKWQLLTEYDTENQLAQAFEEATTKGLK
jgi:hypothetical protein